MFLPINYYPFHSVIINIIIQVMYRSMFPLKATDHLMANQINHPAITGWLLLPLLIERGKVHTANHQRMKFMVTNCVF